MSVLMEGSREIQELLRDSRSRIFEQVPVVMQEELNIIALDARQNHRFTSRTNRLENSIEANVDASTLSGDVSLNPALTSPDGKDYGQHVHNGTAYMAADPFLAEANARQEEAATTNIAESIWSALIGEN